ncbi:PHD finger-like domain-containing protein 5A [Eumeta japonica]|uniref:PHD finger-like domain-containing protein 5A n=1 Tax=Eumeta variegata TaxID=151549 RepID=A0A4C1ZGH1_EUMVA|nr:PHD finger-like domain-containing protein 5A [Eumeta japonica]
MSGMMEGKCGDGRGSGVTEGEWQCYKRGVRHQNETIGRLCEKCDGKCVICDSYVRPCTLVRICDECNYGSYQGRCVICGGPGVSDAYYCKECTVQEKDRDGCPKIVNLGSSKTDLFYERKKYGFRRH